MSNIAANSNLFTERQNAIIQGQKINDISRKDILAIIKKAERLELHNLAEDVFSLYEEEITGDNTFANLSQEEREAIIADCKERLQRLTPWEIDWQDNK